MRKQLGNKRTGIDWTLQMTMDQANPASNIECDEEEREIFRCARVRRLEEFFSGAGDPVFSVGF